MNDSLSRKLGDLQRLDFLAVDELGYLPMDSRQANHTLKDGTTYRDLGGNYFDEWDRTRSVRGAVQAH